MSETLYVTGIGHTIRLKEKYKLDDILYLKNGKYKVVGIESYGDSLYKTYIIKKIKEENKSLKKPREVTPKQSTEHNNLLCCPICDSYVSEDIKPNYCWNCGMKFSWASISEKEDIRSIRKIKGIWESKKDNE